VLERLQASDVAAVAKERLLERLRVPAQVIHGPPERRHLPRQPIDRRVGVLQVLPVRPLRVRLFAKLLPERLAVRTGLLGLYCGARLGCP
jgi:hypothetical protein